MSNNFKIAEDVKPEKFVEGLDYYFENGLFVLTSYFLEKRGFCCDNGCRNCPYSKPEICENSETPNNSRV